MKFISWNVNGLRACMRKGFLDFLKKENPDVCAVQEIKMSEKDVHAIVPLFEKLGYHVFWHHAEKNGYSGTAVLSKQKPLAVRYGIGDAGIDKEGRVIALEFPKFFFVNAYFPHTQRELVRLDFKLAFNKKFQAWCKKLEATKPLVITGDFNVAHTQDDLANPKQNEHNAGFTQEERTWFDAFLKAGFTDTFRMFTKGNGHYTWWTYRSGARARNIGWRIDYFLVSAKLKNSVKGSDILSHVMGSDHCPIELEMRI